MTAFQLRYETEPSKQDKLPVGYRRGQYFFTHPEEHIRSLELRGHTVEVFP